MNLVYKVLGGVAIGLILVKGGVLALISLLKILAPVALGYVAIKSVKGMMRELKGTENDPSTPSRDTIEICPKCGHEKEARHRCKP